MNPKFERILKEIMRFGFFILYSPVALLIVAGLGLSKLNLYLLSKILAGSSYASLFMGFVLVGRFVSKWNRILLGLIFERGRD